jgi:hypothetical protein
MAVGCALVLTATWDIVGFGVEIHGPTNENEVVYRALDLEATEVVQERTDEVGTRAAPCTGSAGSTQNT